MRDLLCRGQCWIADCHQQIPCTPFSGRWFTVRELLRMELYLSPSSSCVNQLNNSSLLGKSKEVQNRIFLSRCSSQKWSEKALLMLQTGRQVSSVPCKVKTLTCLKNETEEEAKIKRHLLFLPVKVSEKKYLGGQLEVIISSHLSHAKLLFT